MLRRLLLPLPLIAGCPAPEDSEPAATVTWSAAFDTSMTGSLSGVWGAAPDDVWMVGGTDVQAEIYHFDGASWSPVTAPSVPLLAWVYGFSSTDVYSVGVDGAAVHWDGTSWSVLDPGTDEDLWGVFGLAPDDIWMVGGNADEDEPLLIHYDGSTFTQVALAAEENNRNATTVYKVWGIGEKLFVVGQNGLILRWDGSAWRGESGGAEANQDFVSLWGTSESNITAVGGRGNARISRYDGTSWTTTAPSGYGGINGVSMIDPDEAVMVGVGGLTATYTPSTGAFVPDDPLVQTDLHAVWGDGAGVFYAVGGSFREPWTGAALRRDVSP